MNTFKKLYFLCLWPIITIQLGLAQTNMISRIEFLQNKIKIIKRSTYTQWTSKNLTPLNKNELTDLTEEHYDSLGNLDYKVTRTFRKFNHPPEISGHYSDDDSNGSSFTYFYKYDDEGNPMEECYKRKNIPCGKWEYLYNSKGKILREITSDFHSLTQHNQTRFHFYNNDGALIKDSVIENGKPLSFSKYEYANGKLQKENIFWNKGLNFQLVWVTTYYYSKDLLIKVVSVNYGPNRHVMSGKQKTYYSYDNLKRLKRVKNNDIIDEYFYGINGNLERKCTSRVYNTKEYYFITYCDLIDYEYYQ